MNNTYLGDPYQQIYMFRGAVNALGKEYTEHIQSIFTQITGFLLMVNSRIFLKFILGSVKANYTYHLTQSFRFGPQIGLVANTYLEKLLGTQSQTLVGGKKKDFIIARRKIFKNLKKYKPVAIIARTNFRLFNKVVKLICDPDPYPSVRFLLL